MKSSVLIAITLLSGAMTLPACSWFGSRRHPMPDPTELVITGAPTGAVIVIDGKRFDSADAAGGRAQVFTVAAGAHRVEIEMGDKVVYREDAYVAAGQHSVVTVLSGSTR